MKWANVRFELDGLTLRRGLSQQEPRDVVKRLNLLNFSPEGFCAMAVKTILQLGDPLLRQKSIAIEDPEIERGPPLVQDLADTLAHWRAKTGYGRGIAAPQLGVLAARYLSQAPRRRALAPDQSGNHPTQRRKNNRLGCLPEFPLDLHASRTEPQDHRALSERRRRPLELRAGDDRNLSELLQHEIDHLDGILAIDRVVDTKTICTREEFEKRFRDGSPYAITPATIKS